jgi:serine/threonine-protein kinase HipA
MVTDICAVYFGDFLVGALEYSSSELVATFEYDADWIQFGFSISPLYMPLRSGVFKFPSLSFETYKGLPAIFSDSLPDDFGNALINAWLARKGLDPADFSALDRLLYTGQRGMGALEYKEAKVFGKLKSFEVNVSDLLNIAQKVLDHRKDFEQELTDDDAMTHLLQIGTSAGGARPKAVIAINQERTKVLSGQVDAPDGYEHYLIKFDGMNNKDKSQQTFGDPTGFGVMEYVYYKMAVLCGITMMPCELFHENNRRHFMTKRFDRVGNQKYHCATLCAIDHADFKKPGHYSYEQLLLVLRKLNLGYETQVEIFRRMVFNVVARNQDDHTKNFSFFVDDDFKWQLAPAYDVAFSCKFDSKWVNQHQLSINGKRDHFVRDDLLAVASHITNLSHQKANKIIDNIISIVKQWPEMAKAENLDPELINGIAVLHRLAI